jgi:hypothetical protein
LFTFVEKYFDMSGITSTIYNQVNITENDSWRILINNISSTKYIIDCSTVAGQKDAYNRCDIVRTVLGESASAIANLKVWAVDSSGKEVKDAKAKMVIEKLRYPNPKQDFKLFFRELDVYCKLHGKAFVRKFRTSVGSVDYYIIPNEFIEVEYENTSDMLYNRKIKQIRVNDGMTRKIYDTDEVHIFYDGTLHGSSNTYEVYGGSRLSSLSDVVSTYVTIWEVACGLFSEGGARNIIGMGLNDHASITSTATKNEKDNLYERLKYKFGFRKGQDKDMIISSVPSVARLTAPIDEMKIPDMLKACQKAICNAYRIPSEVLGVETARYKLIEEGVRLLYTQSAIPTAEYYFSEWLSMLGIQADWSLMADYSHLDFYKASQKDDAIAWQQMAGALVPLIENNIINLEEARIKLGLE